MAIQVEKELSTRTKFHQHMDIGVRLEARKGAD